MLKTFDLGNTENVVYNGKEVLILKLKDKTKETVLLDLTTVVDDEQFNYTALDANYKMEGQLAYDGTPVAYAIGKPTIRYYQQVVPTPTTVEGYNYKYILMPDGTFSQFYGEGDVTELSVVLGETPCYELSDMKEGSLGEKISYSNCNGYNSAFYDGYDFSVGASTIENYIVPEELIIPTNYKGLPIVKILDYAFYGAELLETMETFYQAHNIKSISFAKNSKLEVLGLGSFIGLVQVSADVELPENLKEIEMGAFSKFGIRKTDAQKISATIPESVEKMGQSVFNNWYGNKIIYKAKNAVGETSFLACSTSTIIIFDKSVESLNGQLFSTTPQALVFMHDAEAQIVLNLIKPSKTAGSTTIYTDNTIVQNFDWPTNANITATFKPLSEYTG